MYNNNLSTNPMYHVDQYGNPVDSHGKPMVLLTQDQIAETQVAINETNNRLAATLMENAEVNKSFREAVEYMHSQEAEMVASRKREEMNQAEIKKLQMKLAKFQTKAPFGGKQQYLDSNAFDPGLTLVTFDASSMMESRCIVSTSKLLEAIWVGACTGERYLALKFFKMGTGSTVETECVIYLSDEVYQSNAKLVNHLCQAGIVLTFNALVSKKAMLLREYFSRVGGGQEAIEPELGWINDGSWHFNINEQLKWWDQRKELDIVKANPEKLTSALHMLNTAWSGLAVTEKVLASLPYATKLLPLVTVKGCRNTITLNCVIQEYSPRTVDLIVKLAGAEEVISLPLKEKELSRKLKKSKTSVWIFNVKDSAYKMEDKLLLEKNFRAITEAANGEKIPVYISTAPLLTMELGVVVLEITGNAQYCLPPFVQVKKTFETYISENADKIADRIKMEKIPSELDEWSDPYELFWLTEKVVSNCLREHLGGKIQKPKGNIYEFFLKQKQSADTDGLALHVIDSIQEAVEKGIVEKNSPYDVLRTNSIIVTDTEVYMRREILQRILKESFSAYNETVILRTLHEEGYLVADIGKKVNFTTRRRCTDEEGAAKYLKFVVFRRDKLVEVGDFDYFELS